MAAVDLETRDRRLATLSEALALDPLPVDQAVAAAWSRLYVLLRIPFNDYSWIAARGTSSGGSNSTAISLGLPVVTQDGVAYAAAQRRSSVVSGASSRRSSERAASAWRPKKRCTSSPRDTHVGRVPTGRRNATGL